MSRVAVLVSGNGSNLQALIDAVAAKQLPAEIALVLSNRADAFALARAAKAGIPHVCISHRDYPKREQFDARVVSELRERDVNWVVLAGFMRLITPVFLDAFPQRILNIHPSLLPAFPGVESGRQAFEFGVKVTGCTVHLVTQDMDAGPIVAQTPVPVLESDTLESLMQRIHAAEHPLLVGAVHAAVTGRLQIVRSGSGRDTVRVLSS
jgi:phosphoribosylglycinamide formyltransferase 1